MAMASNGHGERPGPKQYNWAPLFLQAYEVSMNWAASAKAAGVSRHMATQRYNSDAEFAAAVDEAKEMALDALELTQLERAKKGKSDRMAEFLLRAHRPEVYDRPRGLHLSGPGGGPLTFDIGVALDARLSALAAQLEPTADDDSEDALDGEGRLLGEPLPR